MRCRAVPAEARLAVIGALEPHHAAWEGTWIDHYLRRFTPYGLCQGPYEQERLCHGPGICLLSLACGTTGSDPARFSVHELPKDWFGHVPHTHRAIDDARGYAHLLVELLRQRT